MTLSASFATVVVYYVWGLLEALTVVMLYVGFYVFSGIANRRRRVRARRLRGRYGDYGDYDDYDGGDGGGDGGGD